MPTKTKLKVTTRDTKINRIQQIQLQLLKLSSFNELDGKAIADSLVANRELWFAFILDRANYGYHYEREAWIEGKKSTENGDLPAAPIDTIRLRDIGVGYWNVDTLFILPAQGKENALELLVHREWNADEIDWYDSADARHVVLNEPKIGERYEMLEFPRMLRVWWD